MLARFFKRLALGAVLSCLMGFDASAQQPPSSRYEPVGFSFSDETNRQENGPPSVHIPPTAVQDIPGRRPVNGPAKDPRWSTESQAGASHVFSDERGMVRQTSFSQDPGGMQEPSVPEILQRNRPVPQPLAQPQATPRASTNSVQPNLMQGLGSPTSPQQFANQMSQLRQAPPTDAKQDERLEQMKRNFEALHEKRVSRDQAAPGAASSGATSARTPDPRSGAAQVGSANQSPTGFAAAIPSRINNDASKAQQAPAVNPELARQTQTATATRQSANRSGTTIPVTSRPAAQSQPRESVQDFMANGKGTNPTDPGVRLASMQEMGKVQTIESGTIDSLQTADERRAESTIRLSAPSISVESFGPKSIGINKPAIYKVVATNETKHLAERIVVYIDLPKWVEIEKVNMTAGERQMVEEKQQTRMAWKIDQIPGNGSQTMTITAIPRKAEPFDLGIEWTIAPRAGTANIQVTQPKLEMSIVGPEEVQFGDSAPYEVTVRNSGNGNAENVFVMLSEALGGQRAPLGDIPSAGSKVFTVNLEARTPGEVELVVSAVADNQAETNATRKLVIRRANLGISITGPSLRYAGTHGEYVVKLTNTGDATAEEVVAALGLPSGVKFLGGIEAFKLIEGGLRWQIGRLEPGQTREYKVVCQLDASGEVQLEVGTQAKGALQAAHACVTKVQTIADLVMQVNDPPGPLTTGEEITYEIIVENRGTKTAKGVDIFMILSEGMEPKSGSGLEYRIPRDGALQFATIPQLDPGQKISLKVNAIAFKPGTHVFRAHLVCEEADAREIKEGTSRFFGDQVSDPMGNTAENPSFNNSDFQKKLK